MPKFCVGDIVRLNVKARYLLVYVMSKDCHHHDLVLSDTDFDCLMLVIETGLQACSFGERYDLVRVIHPRVGPIFVEDLNVAKGYNYTLERVDING